MPSTSTIVNRALRQAVRPVLTEAGFTMGNARNAWMWLDRAVCVFHVRAVGSYFSQVTGWPPGSLGVWIAVFYTFMPAAGELRGTARVACCRSRCRVTCVRTLIAGWTKN